MSKIVSLLPSVGCAVIVGEICVLKTLLGIFFKSILCSFRRIKVLAKVPLTAPWPPSLSILRLALTKIFSSAIRSKWNHIFVA